MGKPKPMTLKRAVRLAGECIAAECQRLAPDANFSDLMGLDFGDVAPFGD